MLNLRCVAKETNHNKNKFYNGKGQFLNKYNLDPRLKKLHKERLIGNGGNSDLN